MKNNLIAWISLVVAIASIGLGISQFKSKSSTIAFIDTQRVLTAFKEAHVINTEIKVEDQKWREKVQIMNDSLKIFMERMSEEFDEGSAQRKKELQDELSFRNSQINNYQNHHVKQIKKMTSEKMTGVYAKIDAFLKEFGDENKYEIILGTSQGNIVYGTGSAADVTNDVIKSLNQRYE